MMEEWRDLAAGLALVGLLTSGERGEDLGRKAYEYADFLISARDEDNKTGIIAARKRRVPKQEAA
jgi:hypothetical protein